MAGFATVWVVIGCGWLAARLGLLGADSQQPMANLAFYLGLPPMLLLAMARADLAQAFAPHLAASVAAMAVVVLAYLATNALIWRGELGDVVTGVFGAHYVNAANIGIPVATYVLGDPTWSVPVLLVQVAVLQPIGLAIYDVRNARLRGERPGWVSRVTLPLRNPITIAAGLGLALNLTGTRLPTVVGAPLELLAQLAVPTMLVAFGVSLATGGLPGRSPRARQVGWIVLLKLVMMPLAAWLLTRFVFDLGAATAFAVTVMAGLPTAQNVFLNALRYDTSVALAREVVFFATLGSLVTLPVIALLAHP